MTKQEHNRCPYCNRIIDKREIALYRGLIESLGKIYKWCKVKGIHEFTMKHVKGLLGHNDYARFGDLVLFGGLVYKNGRARYGLNMERCEDFFAGKTKIPTKILKDPITRELEKLEYKTVRDIPGLMKFLNEEGLYESRYVPKEDVVNQVAQKLL